MEEVRCVKCGRLLLKAESVENVEIKCPKCHFKNRLNSEYLGACKLKRDPSLPKGMYRVIEG